MRYIIAMMLVFSASVQAKNVIWLTGLPCAGKTTIANQFNELFPNTVVLDGDVVRRGLNADLGFTPEDRKENLRRITELACLTLKSCDHVVVACVSPMQGVRNAARARVEKEGYKFIEVFVNANVETCIERDVKGMYAKAISGEIPIFTGVSAPYESPEKADIVCNTDDEDAMQSTQKIINYLGLVSPRERHALFVGRWSPFHKGHFGIMKECHKENPDRPLLVMIRDNVGEYWTSEYRKGMVEASMKAMNIRATVMVIPDIDSVNWGRGVGYTPRQIEVSEKMKGISGTKIREGIKNNEDSWKQFVNPGVAEYILANPQ